MLVAQTHFESLWQDHLDNRALGQPVDDGSYEEHVIPQRVITLSDTIQIIGQTIAPLPELSGEDPDFSVKPQHLELVLPDEINSGLYFQPVSSNRFRGVNQRVRVFDGQSRRNLPGMVSPQTEVAFPEEDHARLAHSALYMAIHSNTTTRTAQPQTNNSPEQRKENDRKSNSSSAKTMASKIAAIDQHEALLTGRHDIFTNMYRGLRTTPPIHYRPANALGLIGTADHELRRMVEVSGRERKLSEEDRAASQRALTTVLYRLPRTQSEVASMWRAYLKLGGLYINARRGKLDESRNASEKIYTTHRGSIKPDEVAGFDEIVYGEANEKPAELSAVA